MSNAVITTEDKIRGFCARIDSAVKKGFDFWWSLGTVLVEAEFVVFSGKDQRENLTKVRTHAENSTGYSRRNLDIIRDVYSAVKSLYNSKEVAVKECGTLGISFLKEILVGQGALPTIGQESQKLVRAFLRWANSRRKYERIKLDELGVWKNAISSEAGSQFLNLDAGEYDFISARNAYLESLTSGEDESDEEVEDSSTDETENPEDETGQREGANNNTVTSAEFEKVRDSMVRARKALAIALNIIGVEFDTDTGDYDALLAQLRNLENVQAAEEDYNNGLITREEMEAKIAS